MRTLKSEPESTRRGAVPQTTRRSASAKRRRQQPVPAGATWWLALASSLLLWAALPPLDFWPLAWIAPVGWLLLVRVSELPGRRPYRALWVAGFFFWMAALHWLRLPHWATSFGWIAVSIYLAFYIPAFVALSRVAVHRLRIPIVFAAPVVWTGLELVRAHLLTGFTMASLGHTQYRWIELIQISDLAGAYGVSFLVMMVAACVARMLPSDGRPATAWPLASPRPLSVRCWRMVISAPAQPKPVQVPRSRWSKDRSTPRSKAIRTNASGCCGTTSSCHKTWLTAKRSSI